MASVFSRETPVAWFGARPPKEHGQNLSKSYLLWPAIAYRVIAPCPEKRKMNLFQRACLGFCRTGLRDAEGIARKLDIDWELAAWVLNELQEMEYLGADGKITSSGEIALYADTDYTSRLEAGYVFQDPWSGELWMRFENALELYGIERMSGSFAEVVLKDGMKKRALCVQEVAGLSSRPGALDVIKAISKAKGFQHLGLDFDALPGFSGQERRVSYIDENSMPLFLMTSIYVPSARGFGAEWFCCNPFGKGISGWLRRRVEQKMESHHGLKTLVENRVNKAVAAGSEGYRAFRDKVQLRAEENIRRRFANTVLADVVRQSLLEVECMVVEAESVGNGFPQSKFGPLLRECSKILELLLGDIAKHFPNHRALRKVQIEKNDGNGKKGRLELIHEREVLTDIYQRAAADCGFLTPLPQAFNYVTAGKIQAAIQPGQHWALRPLIVATVLSAQDDESHPFRKVAKVNESLLKELNDIAEIGGKAGHATDSRFSLDNVRNTFSKTYDIVQALY